MTEQSLAELLNRELGDDNSFSFMPAGRAVDSPATVVHGSRTVSVISNGATYLLAVWWKEREQAHGVTSELPAAVGSSRMWVEGAGLERLAAACPFVTFSGLQLASERGEAKDYQWRAVLEQADGDFAHYRDLVLLASQDTVLKRLFPHLGHRFALSEGEDGDGVLVAVFARYPNRYVIFEQGGAGAEFEGDARQIVALLASRFRR